jgi:hypothetical protein
MQLMPRIPVPSPSRLVALYPRRWRDRYEAEMLVLLGDRPPDWRAAIDLVQGAIDAHLHPATPSLVPIIAALLAGAGWSVVALAALLEPVPADWPGYLAWSLPAGLIATGAGLVASMAFALRGESAPGRAASLAIGVGGLGQVVAVLALAIASVGGPYGAATGAAGSIGAIGLILIGLALPRSVRYPPAEALVVAGGVLLLPPLIGWVLAATAWIAIGLSAALGRVTATTEAIPPV